jgi:hypothetical protein
MAHQPRRPQYESGDSSDDEVNLKGGTEEEREQKTLAVTTGPLQSKSELGTWLIKCHRKVNNELTAISLFVVFVTSTDLPL